MRKKLWIWQVLLLAALFAFWHVATNPELLPPFVWDDPHRAAFFFGEPVKILKVIVEWFASGEIYPHLWVTLQETALAFVIGSVLGLVIGLWLGLTHFYRKGGVTDEEGDSPDTRSHAPGLWLRQQGLREAADRSARGQDQQA